jgi:hypothetical protein
LEVEHVDSDQAAEEEGSPSEGSVASDESQADATKHKRPEKKGPMKLPKASNAPTTKNTKDAAAETLKKYFGGR